MVNNEKVWSVADIKIRLEKSDEMVARSLVKLYDYQTVDEQGSEQTFERNGVGFNGVDSQFMSSVAAWVKKGNKMSAKQLVSVRKTIMKYAGQLTKIANGVI